MSSFLEKGQDLLITGIDRWIDKETREEVVIVRDPTPTVTASGGGENTSKETFDAGAPARPQTPEVFGMPWHQALLIGSAGLLVLGVGLKLATR